MKFCFKNPNSWKNYFLLDYNHSGKTLKEAFLKIKKVTL